MPKKKPMNAMAKTVLQPDTGLMEIANPFRLRAPDLKVNPVGELGYVEDRITVARTLRSDYLAQMHAQHNISDALYHAGRRWQELYEQSQVSGIGSSGDIKEPVDGSRPIREPITDKQQKATKRLMQLDAVIGGAASIIIRDVLGAGMTLAQHSRAHGMIADKNELARLGKRLRGILETVARELGYGG